MMIESSGINLKVKSTWTKREQGKLRTSETVDIAEKKKGGLCEIVKFAMGKKKLAKLYRDHNLSL